jgi:predicted HTH domain antitoxin
MMEVIIKVPDDLGLTDRELRMNLAAKLFDQGLISSGQGAAMVGISKTEFIRQIGRYGVSLFQYTADEMLEDLQHGAPNRHK